MVDQSLSVDMFEVKGKAKVQIQNAEKAKEDNKFHVER